MGPAKFRLLQRLFRSVLTASAPRKPAGHVPLTHPEIEVRNTPKPSKSKVYRLNACIFLLVKAFMCLEC